MKRYGTAVLLILLGFLFSCAGGNSAGKKPESPLSGLKAIKKGISLYQKGCYDRSLEHFYKAHEFFAASDHLSGVAMSMNNIGNIYRIKGDPGNAALFFEESFNIYSDLKNDDGMVQALSNKAAALIDGGELAEAAGVLDMAEDIAREKGCRSFSVLNNRGVLLTRKEEYVRAGEVLAKALAAADPLNLSDLATVNFALGNLMVETKRFEKAIDYFGTALEADRSVPYYKGIADDLAAIGSVYFSRGECDLAVKFWQRGIKIYALIGDEKNVSDLMGKLDEASKRAGIDIRVTRHFVKSWLAGEALENFCR
ncbi:MAG TPA: tetratricopeptide repeat protein [Desulfobacterales bacterium]|nr:tetratricopeptide repeat protein [Desulfobacterales bacterium]